MRFEDTPNLFGCGVGHSTLNEIRCGICGTVYKARESEEEYIRRTDFAGIEVCDSCFEKIEREILRRMPDILPWFTRILEVREKQNERDRMLIKMVREALTKQ